jgi:hypothetical protein
MSPRTNNYLRRFREQRESIIRCRRHQQVRHRLQYLASLLVLSITIPAIQAQEKLPQEHLNPGNSGAGKVAARTFEGDQR